MKQLFKRHEQDITSFVMRFDDAQAMDEKVGRKINPIPFFNSLFFQSDLMVEFLDDVQSFMSEDEAFDSQKIWICSFKKECLF